MLENSNYLIESQLKKCLEVFNEITGKVSDVSVESYMQQIGFLNQQGTTIVNAVIAIMDMTSLTFRYVANTDVSLGISTGDFYNKGFSAFLSSMPEENTMAIPTLFKFLLDSVKLADPLVRNKFVAYGYGIKHRRPSGKVFSTLVQIFSLESDKDGKPLLCLVVDQDIEHLTRNVTQYRGRVSFGNDDLITTFSSEDMALKVQDIFSNREIDVLKYLLRGHESKQIAEKLFISSNTVDNHRKNMLKKLEARDTTALVQLSKLLGILR